MMVMVNRSNETIVHASIVLLGLVLFLIITGIALKNKEEVRIGEKEIGLLGQISGISNTFDNWLSRGQSDAIFLSNDGDIRGYAETSDVSLTDASTELFLAFAKAKKRFYQLEFINETGQELIRIYHDPSVSDYTALPHEQLPGLSNVSYFKKTIGLRKGEIYISDIHPIKPSSPGVSDEVIIIYATPVINSTGARKGVVAVSLHVDTITENLHKELVSGGHDEEYLVVDQDGYYIYNYKNRAKEFGQYTGTDENLRKDYPDSAQIMLSGTDGKLLDINTGLANFRTYRYNPSNLSQYIVIIGINKFALIYQILLDGIVIVIGLISYVFLIYAYRNFIKGDFKRLLRSMLLILTFFFIYKFLEISETYFEKIEGVFIIEQTTLILGILIIVEFAYQLLEFSKLYGFADKKVFKK